MSERAGLEVTEEEGREEDRPSASRWVQRRFRRMVIGVVVSGAVLTATAGLLLRSRRGKP